MRIFTFLKKESKLAAPPLWSRQVGDETLHYHGEEISIFLKEFDRIEDEFISLWAANKVTWEAYMHSIVEIQEARQLFVQFAYN